LRACIDQLAWRFSAATLFTQILTARFVPSNYNCVRCKKKLKVLKTHKKTAATLEIGLVRIHETIKHCESCHEVYRCDEPRKLVPHGCKFGFNVLVDVGMALFVECRNEKQIQAELKSRGKIKDLLLSRGGYILHLDGTCEGDSPHLMSALDGIAQIVLENIKIPSEKADKIIPFLRRIRHC